MPTAQEIEQQRKYQTLVASIADYVVSCNIASLRVMDTDEEVVETKDDFVNHGSDIDTIQMIMESSLIDAAVIVKEKQSKMFK